MFRFTKKEEMILLVILVTLVLGSGIIGVKYLKGEESKQGFAVDEADSKLNTSKVTISKQSNEEQSKKIESRGKIDKILVQVGGAVKQPGVYKLKRGSRVYRLIEKAQGATSEADLDQINLAVKLRDGEKVIIPIKDKTNSNTSVVSKPKRDSKLNNKTNKININTASRKELQKLYRIGPALSERIVNYRKQHGGFSELIELKEVSGIGDKTFQRNKENLTL